MYRKIRNIQNVPIVRNNQISLDIPFKLENKNSLILSQNFKVGMILNT